MASSFLVHLLHSASALFPLLLLLFLVASVSPSNRHHHSNHHRSATPAEHGHNWQGENLPKGPHQRQDVPRGTSPNGAAPCGGCGGPSAGAQWRDGVPSNGVPLFLFPDNVIRSVDVVLRNENAFHRDNGDLARHLFHLLANQFPRKWFLVGVGTLSPNGVKVPQIWALEGMDVLNGTVQLHNPPAGFGSYPFFHERRFQRQNGSQIWYFVFAIDPTRESQSNERKESLAKCVPKKGICSVDKLASFCAINQRPLAMALQFSPHSEVSIFASEAMATDSATMALAKESKECLGEDNEEEEHDELGVQQHILLVANPEGEKQ